MADPEQFRFVSELARDLNSGDVSLPSLPNVVTKIRSLLEQEHCDFDQVSRVVRVDPVLVSRLMVFANSAYHNQTGEAIASLDAAISRLGFELVRNTAVSLAIKQLFLGEKHRAIASYLRDVWTRSMKMSAMSFALASRRPDLNDETAFMCGLLHEVGKLYILTKARDYPSFLGNAESIQSVFDEWHPRIGKSIVEVWNFPEEVCDSLDPDEYLLNRTHMTPTVTDVVYVANLLLDASADEPPDFASMPSCVVLDVSVESTPEIDRIFQEKLLSVQQSLTQAA